MHLPGQFGPFSARWGDSERVENGGEHQRPDGRKASSPTRECSKIEVFRIWSVQNIDRLIQPGVLSQRGEAETAAGSVLSVFSESSEGRFGLIGYSHPPFWLRSILTSDS